MFSHNHHCRNRLHVLHNDTQRCFPATGVFVLSGGDCTSSPDRLVVRDGVDPSSAGVLTVLCGTRNGETVTSSGEALSVQLLTDVTRQRQGFAATFSFVDAASVTPPTGGGDARRPTATTISAAAAAVDGEDAGWSPYTDNGQQINVPGTSQLSNY